MEFVPKQAEEGINVSRRHPLAEALTVTLGVGAFLAVATAVAIFLVDIVIAFVSPETEARIFAQWSIERFIDDELSTEDRAYVQELAARLASRWPENPYSIRVEILEQDEPNAFALPGGTILISKGLIAQAGSENEIAFVLGHEIGHLRNRDHLRGLGRGVALGILWVSISGRDGGFIGGGAIDWTSRAFSRRQETEADLFGLELVYREYGHVADSWQFFDRIDEGRNRFETLSTYFSTHPPSDSRIDELLQHASRNGWPLEGKMTVVGARRR